ncbi:MAG TPA: penicillin-insensitive murein endopeptidase [Solirubrobacterales bacterium]|nr:penicillin-insensitive murein endopeptidase [Solirubrobacterales bacterium]
MRASVLLLLALLAIGLAACDEGSRKAATPAAVAPGEPDESPESMLAEAIEWRRSTAVGRTNRGRLLNGVQLPSEGEHFFTWDPIHDRTPNRPWRRHATDRMIRVLLGVLAEFRAANPGAPRIGIGDLSRPQGGNFGERYGPPGHASHQNGLDADVYYPRRDRQERGPANVGQVDRALAQDLVDRFVRSGARFVFVGLRVGLRGPRRVVQAIPLHDNHLHVRIR